MGTETSLQTKANISCDALIWNRKPHFMFFLEFAWIIDLVWQLSSNAWPSWDWVWPRGSRHYGSFPHFCIWNSKKEMRQHCCWRGYFSQRPLAAVAWGILLWTLHLARRPRILGIRGPIPELMCNASKWSPPQRPTGRRWRRGRRLAVIPHSLNLGMV